MCIERIPPSNFMGSSGHFTTEVQPEVPADIDQDFDIDYEIDLDEYNVTDESSEWNDYLWMENAEEFEQQEIRRLEEEELANECMEAMSEMLLLDEIRQVEAEQHKEYQSDLAQKSNLNPFAEEFFPADVVITYI